MDSELDLSEFCCLNEDCPDYGKKGKGNVRVKERYGLKNRALLRCNTCTHCFSETKGTIFFGLKTPDEEVLRTLAMIPEKGSICGTGRATGYNKDTICRWLDITGAHCEEVTDYFFQELELGQVQMGEKVQVAAKKPEVKRDNPASHTRNADQSQSMSSPADQILHLQRTIGNQAVQRLIKSGALQAKLKIGPPRDKYEQEADRVADAVMRIPDPGVQRQVDEEENENEETLQTKPLVNQITPLVQVQRQEEPEEEEEMLQAKPLA